MEAGRIEETIYFGREAGAQLTYALVHEKSRKSADVMYEPQLVIVAVPSRMAERWAETDEVGMSAEIDLGARGSLSVLIEKDFACLDKSDAENEDTFPNPLAGHIC